MLDKRSKPKYNATIRNGNLSKIKYFYLSLLKNRWEIGGQMQRHTSELLRNAMRGAPAAGACDSGALQGHYTEKSRECQLLCRERGGEIGRIFMEEATCGEGEGAGGAGAYRGAMLGVQK